MKAYRFDRLVEGMMAPEMILETMDIIKGAIGKGMLLNLIINNRAGGNAPIIAREIATKFLGKKPPAPNTTVSHISCKILQTMRMLGA